MTAPICAELQAMEVSEVPFVIVTDIMCKLPVKDLLRFKCVSKLWGSTINSPNFVKDHLNNNSDSKVLSLVDDEHLYFIEPNSQEMDVEKLDYPVDTKEVRRIGYVKVIGICNGLVALWFRVVNEHFALWNPSTREGKLIFPTYDWKYRVRSQRIACYGLGYDVANNDYKIVIICGGVFMKFAVVVYSLRSDSWKTFSEDFILVKMECGFRHVYSVVTVEGTSCNGALHWVLDPCEDDNTSSLPILAFDLEKEEFRMMPGPQAKSVESDITLFAMGGRLRFAEWEEVTDNAAGSFKTIDIWEMKEYGVKESWVKLLCFPPIARPLQIIGDSVLVWVRNGYMIWYNWQKAKGGINKLELLPCRMDKADVWLWNARKMFCYFYTPSLVSIKALKASPKKKKKKGSFEGLILKF